MPAAPLDEVLARLVVGRAAPAGAAWLEAALLDATGAGEAFLAAVAGAGRRLGRAPLVLAAEERAALLTAGMEALPGGWGLDECGRGALVLRAASRLGGEATRELARELFYRGEVGERQALLRVLAYLPEPETLLEIGAEACRSSVGTVFEAIACENPYPARHFPEAGFNQLVLKALFTGVAARRILGLERRMNDDLRRMAEGYASERRAAGRPVAQDAERIAAGERRP